MKYILSLVFFLYTLSSFAAVSFDVIRTNQYISENDLANECKSIHESTKNKLELISTRLTGDPSKLTATATYGIETNVSTVPQGPRLPPRQVINYEYYCILKFTTNDPTLYFKNYIVTRFIHTGSRNINNACQPAFEEAQMNENSPISIYWKGWTIIQGYMCEVTTIEVNQIDSEI